MQPRRKTDDPGGSRFKSDWPYWPRPAPPASWDEIEVKLASLEAGARLGPADAVTCFIETLWRHVWVAAARHVRRVFDAQHSDAEDAVSQVFAGLIAAIRAARWPEGRVHWCAYVMGAARYRYLSSRRNRHDEIETSAFDNVAQGRQGTWCQEDGWHPMSFLDRTLVTEESPAKLAVAREETDAASRAIESLPSRERAVLELWRQRLTHSEIAKQLGIALGASYVALHRGLARLEHHFIEDRKTA